MAEPLALDVRDLEKVYANRFRALDGVSVDVAPGDFFALLGPNGAGKSTLIGIVSGLVRKTGGLVRVFGHDLDAEPEALKACIGVVPQEFNFHLFESPLEIVVNQAGYYGLPRRVAAPRAEGFLERLGLWGHRNGRSRDLSGGMKRRLMIARALVHHPRLLILDEPTAGVDIELRRSMWEYLTEINTKGTTIILTTHYLEEAERLCENLAIIDRGRIVEDTDMKTLLNRLHVETFVLDLAVPLGAPPDLGGLAARLQDETTLEVEVTRDAGVSVVFDRLSAQGVRVLSMRNKANRLEELFLELVRPGNERGGAPRSAAT
jgi:ABC-2 type transport system ATP-binding protein